MTKHIESGFYTLNQNSKEVGQLIVVEYVVGGTVVSLVEHWYLYNQVPTGGTYAQYTVPSNDSTGVGAFPSSTTAELVFEPGSAPSSFNPTKAKDYKPQTGPNWGWQYIAAECHDDGTEVSDGLPLWGTPQINLGLYSIHQGALKVGYVEVIRATSLLTERSTEYWKLYVELPSSHAGMAIYEAPEASGDKYELNYVDDPENESIPSGTKFQMFHMDCEPA